MAGPSVAPLPGTPGDGGERDDAAPERETTQPGDTPERATALFRLAGVGFEYAPGSRRSPRSIWRSTRGERLAILGANGSGKSRC